MKEGLEELDHSVHKHLEGVLVLTFPNKAEKIMIWFSLGTESETYVNLWTCLGKPDQCRKDHFLSHTDTESNVGVVCLPSRRKSEQGQKPAVIPLLTLSLPLSLQPSTNGVKISGLGFHHLPLSSALLMKYTRGKQGQHFVTPLPVKAWWKLECSWLRHINWSHMGNPWYCNSFITICCDLKTVYPDNGLEPADHNKVFQHALFFFNQN